MQYFFADAPMKKKISKILCTRVYSTFWTPSTKIFFCFNQKNLFTNPSWNYFYISKKIFLGFWDPLGPPYDQNENFCMWGHGYQNWVKRVLWVHFWRNSWKIFKNEGFGHKFWDTQYKIYFCSNQKNLFTNPNWNNF